MFYTFCLNQVDYFHVQNIIGKLSSNQVSPTGVRSLSNTQLLANFLCASRSVGKILVFKEGYQWIIFKKSLVLHCKISNYFCILDPKFKHTTIQPGDDQVLYNTQNDWFYFVFLTVLKTAKKLTGKIACNRKINHKTALINDFAYLFDEMKDAAAHLNATTQYQKLQSKPPSSCAAHCTNIDPIWVHHIDVVDDNVIDIDSSPADTDNRYPFDHFEAMLSAVDISSYHNPCTIMAFATHQFLMMFITTCNNNNNKYLILVPKEIQPKARISHTDMWQQLFALLLIFLFLYVKYAFNFL